jgi:uncharacterized damage-inducible protein DinB
MKGGAMSPKDFATTIEDLHARLDAAHKRLAEALAALPAEQAYKGSEWSVADCLNHLAPREGGYSRYVESLLGQEKPAARAFSQERRWTHAKEFLTAEYERCRAALGRVTPERWSTPVAQPDGSTKPLSNYVQTMVSHFEEHTSQIIDQIIPRVRA